MDSVLVTRIHSAIRKRNALETEPFEELLAAQLARLASESALRQQNKALSASLLRLRHEAAESEHQALESALANSNKREEDLRAKVTDLTSDNELLRVELEHWKERLEASERKVESAEKEAAQLVERIVLEKAKAAAQINEMNLTVEALQNRGGGT
mmetsp:Transcript_17893/g.67886  ORF Transcript_17893/g.67886 Transcript_17893/m.67886 type:complete len:156 (-) Transcript_17893:1492-1959(-)|eukprot:scaffold228_cov312-Pinguiococcus_pyrenoidosus.AAC.50